jgi:antitoxin YobK
MKAYEEAVFLMKTKPDALYFEGNSSDKLIEDAEQRLNVRFPPTYKRFLTEYGAGSFGGSEFYGSPKINMENY